MKTLDEDNLTLQNQESVTVSELTGSEAPKRILDVAAANLACVQYQLMDRERMKLKETRVLYMTCIYCSAMNKEMSLERDTVHVCLTIGKASRQVHVKANTS